MKAQRSKSVKKFKSSVNQGTGFKKVSKDETWKAYIVFGNDVVTIKKEILSSLDMKYL